MRGRMDIDVRAVAWEWLTKGLGYEGAPSQKREREKSFFFLHKVSSSYLQNLL
jgi:hypothetical protein